MARIDDFKGSFRCFIADVNRVELRPRGSMNFKDHIDDQGKVTRAPHHIEHDDGSTEDVTVSGSISQVGGADPWVLDLKRDDKDVTYKGFLFQDDGKVMRLGVLKHDGQPFIAETRGKKDEKRVPFDQVDEPWVITKP